MREKTFTTSVCIVGAGPVGLTLAIDLASRGVEVVVVERRCGAESRRVKCNHIAARSMEIFRRLGVASKLRSTGLPESYPNDVSFRTTVTGVEMARIPIPCRRDRYTATGGADTWWATPEPPHRLNQIFMEPILWDHAAGMAQIRIIDETEIDAFVQDEARVVALAHDLSNGTRFAIECDYLIGCDGGKSRMRKAIGARFVGDAVVQRVQSSYIRAPKLIEHMGCEPAWAIVNLNPRRNGTLYAIDGRERWLVHNYLKPEEEDFEAIDRDWSIRTILGVDQDFEYEIINKEDWIGRRLVADKFRERRVFICGDAAHIWVPYAGYGMNAGIADAANLAWLLAAHLNGWADEAILDAYELERLPITEQVSRFAMNHAHEMIRNRRRVPENIEASGDEADATRAEYGQELYDLNVQQYCCGGLNFGSYYDRSPLIAYDGDPHPTYSMAEFSPSTVPGCRTPHYWLDNGRSLYDEMGAEYALLRFDNSVQIDRLLAAAKARHMPLTVLDLDPRRAPPAYQSKLLISRPDQHVAWRGNAQPDDPRSLIDLLCGHPALNDSRDQEILKK